MNNSLRFSLACNSLSLMSLLCTMRVIIIVYRHKSVFIFICFFISQYAMFLLAFFLLEAAVGVFLYVNRGQVEGYTRNSMNNVFNDYNNKSESRAFVDELQTDVSALRRSHCSITYYYCRLLRYHINIIWLRH